MSPLKLHHRLSLPLVLLVLLFGPPCAFLYPIPISDHSKEYANDWAKWRAHYADMKLPVSGQRLGDAHPALLDYNYMLPEVAMRRAAGYIGTNHRLRRVVWDLLQGKAVHIGAVGGSITWGQGYNKQAERTLQIGVEDWFSRLGSLLRKAFPGAPITTSSSAVPATGASYATICLQRGINVSSVDVVIAEYMMNERFEDVISTNPVTMVTERLARRVLRLPRSPALVLLQLMPHFITFEDDRPDRQPFYHTNEDPIYAVAHYYDLQVVSHRAATYRIQRQVRQPNLTYADTGPSIQDPHPNERGALLVAELVFWLFQRTALELLLLPQLSPTERDMMDEPLPEPIWPGNYAPTHTVCEFGQAFLQDVYLNHTGDWTWVNEGSEHERKMGFTAHTPGSILHLRFNASVHGPQQRTPGQGVRFMVAHLGSYQHMGQAEIRCVSGCTCPGRVVDAHQPQWHASPLAYTLLLTMDEVDECVVSIKLLNSTNSGETKFRVLGLMMAMDGVNSGRGHIMEGPTIYDETMKSLIGR